MASELQADVVVIGGGAGGLMAAIEAHDRGASVILLESEPQTGGSTCLSGGYVAMCETELQPGTKAELLADLIESHHHDANEVLSHVYVDNAPELYVRLKDLGLDFRRLETYAHMSRPWAHELPLGELGGGAQIAAALAAGARARGIDIRVSTRAERLVRDETGRVTGVEAQAGTTTTLVQARRGVVLASGGFTRNPALIKCFGRPGSEKIIPITGPGSRGDGLRMGMGLGADLSYVGVGVAPPAPIDPVTTEPSLVVYAGGIMLNKQGQRFVDESRVYLDICWAGLQQTDGFMLQVYDSRIRAAYLGSMMGVVMFGATEYRADTLAELFTQVSHADVGAASPSGSADIDVPASLASVATYNQYVADGHDPDFGRRHPLGNGGIGSEDGELRPIEAGPFYAAVTVAGTTHFNGGLAIDDQMRVIDVFARPIPGLFAAGEVVGGFHGAGYLSATFLGSAMIFGRVAGQNAARGL